MSLARTLSAELAVAVLGLPVMALAVPVGMVRLAVAQPALVVAVATGGHGAGLLAFERMVNA